MKIHGVLALAAGLIAGAAALSAPTVASAWDCRCDGHERDAFLGLGISFYDDRRSDDRGDWDDRLSYGRAYPHAYDYDRRYYEGADYEGESGVARWACGCGSYYRYGRRRAFQAYDDRRWDYGGYSDESYRRDRYGDYDSYRGATYDGRRSYRDDHSREDYYERYRDER